MIRVDCRCIMLTFGILLTVDGALKTNPKNIKNTSTTPDLETTSILYTTEVNETEFSCNSTDTTCADYVTIESTTSITNDILNISTTNETPVIIVSPKLQSEIYRMSASSTCSCNLQVKLLLLGLYYY